jgi:hypothetical protein
MSSTEPPPSHTSSAPSSTPSSAPTPNPQLLSEVVVSGTAYARIARDGQEYVVIPGIPANGQPGIQPIGARAIPFRGYPTLVQVMLRQANRVIDRDGGYVSGATQWSVALDGVLVYCPAIPSMDAFMALTDAQVAVRKLLSHPIRWQDPEDWTDRAVYYQGVPAWIRSFTPARGEVLLQADEGFSFPPTPITQELGTDPTPEERTAVLVDLLSDRVWWSRQIPGVPPDEIGDSSHG